MSNPRRPWLRPILVGAGLAAALLSSCGSPVPEAPAHIAVDTDASESARPQHGTPDAIERRLTATDPGSAGDDPGQSAPPCIYSADAAERLGRPPCED